MKLYEIINPSDPYTFLAPDRQVATLVIFVLSTSFAATCLSHPGEDEDVPLFLLGGAKSWWAETYPGQDIEDVFERRADEIANALASVLHGGEEARQEFTKLAGPITNPSDLEEMRLKWNESKRTSFNDISGAAYSTAKSIREKYPTAQ